MLSRKESKIMIIGMSIIMIVVIVGMAYAAFTGQLNINSGNAVGRKSAWDIRFDKVSSVSTTGTAKVLNSNPPKINNDNPRLIDDYDVSLTSPNDSISFTFNVLNSGNYNAKITKITIGSPECDVNGDKFDTSAVNMCNNLTYSLTYEGGATVNVNDIVYAKDYITLKVTLTFKNITNPELLPTDDVNISNLGIELDFEQVGSAEVNETTGEVTEYKVYHQGEKITLNNEDYYVIANSGAGQDYVVALKDEPLTVEEVNLYGGVGTENNHVNKYTASPVGTASGSVYGGMAYYSSETCGYVDGTWCWSNYCQKNYNESDIKYVVDEWARDKFQNNELKEVNGYSARLINSDEYTNISSYSWQNINPHWYWTMVYGIYGYEGNFINYQNVTNNGGTVRPVINVYKSALEN